MRLLHSLLALFHARRARRHSTLYRWHVEQCDGRMRSAREIAGRGA